MDPNSIEFAIACQIHITENKLQKMIDDELRALNMVINHILEEKHEAPSGKTIENK